MMSFCVCDVCFVQNIMCSRTALWTLSNVVKAVESVKPFLEAGMLDAMVSCLNRAMAAQQSQSTLPGDVELAMSVFWLAAYATAKASDVDIIPSVVASGLVGQMLEYAALVAPVFQTAAGSDWGGSAPAPSALAEQTGSPEQLLFPVFRTVGNVAFDCAPCLEAMGGPLLDLLRALVAACTPKESLLLRELLWSIGLLVAGSPEFADQLVHRGIMDELARWLREGMTEIQREVCRTLYHV